jgi:hypothetical protein
VEMVSLAATDRRALNEHMRLTHTHTHTHTHMDVQTTDCRSGVGGGAARLERIELNGMRSRSAPDRIVQEGNKRTEVAGECTTE